MRFLFAVTFFAVATFSFVPLAFADTTPLASYAGCTGTDCSACNLVDLANGLLKWLIGFLFLIFAVILAVAGFGLLTSGGSHHALDEAKSKFTNAFVGMLIVLSAWLVVDTIMRGLVGKGGNDGKVEYVTGWLYWTDVQCQEQTKPDSYHEWEDVIALSLDGVGSWTVDSSGIPSTPCSITGYSGGAPVYDCSAQMAECSARGGGLPSESADGRSVTCTPDPDLLGGGGAGGGNGANCPAASESQMRYISGTGYKARPDVASKVEAMRSAAAADGISLRIISGWRSEQTQVDIWNSHSCNVKSCSGIVAKPCSMGGNGSNHNQGEAVDISLSNPSPTLTWLMSNAGRFGLHNNLPRDRVHWSLSGG